MKKIYRKEKLPDRTRNVYIFGIKVFSYKKKRKYKQLRIVGTNNHIHCPEEVQAGLSISVYGEHNSIDIRTKKYLIGSISIGTPDCPVSGCSVSVGEDTTAEEFRILLLDSNSSVEIGRDCMLSSGINIWASDTHSIIDQNGKLLNLGHSVTIGDHVWLGLDSKILKNTKIADNSIVGMGSIVTSEFHEPNCVLAGIPAKIVKRNINWDRKRPSQWQEKEISH